MDANTNKRVKKQNKCSGEDNNFFRREIINPCSPWTTYHLDSPLVVFNKYNILEHDRVRFVNIMDTSKWTSCVLCRRLCCLCLVVTGNIWLDESHGGCVIRSRNSLPFASTWDQPRYIGGVLLIFFVCLRSVSCYQCCLWHWIVHTWLFLRFSLTFIYMKIQMLLGLPVVSLLTWLFPLKCNN
jgi:hypothetical protein